ncbi:hypothetical protein [Solilutibacter silvestris]|uniref:hypothetical protein n=1 Tax=Solilutibacter silvestris TaxID=1645665 RepID=UPI003D34B208
MAKSTPARLACETHLREEIQRNTEAQIAFSETAVAQRLLAASAAMGPVYDEIYPPLSKDGMAFKIFLNCLTWMGAYMTPEQIAQERADRAELIAVNRDIEEAAETLASLLEQRQELHERSGFGSETLYDIAGVIDQAGDQSGRYGMLLKPELDKLNVRYDLKYWPSLAECIRAISDDARRAEVTPNDSVTAVATESQRPSKSDFIRGLLAQIDRNKGDYLGGIPTDFTMSNDDLATIVNVILDLPVTELADANSVKVLRHRMKPRC